MEDCHRKSFGGSEGLIHSSVWQSHCWRQMLIPTLLMNKVFGWRWITWKQYHVELNIIPPNMCLSRKARVHVTIKNLSASKSSWYNKTRIEAYYIAVTCIRITENRREKAIHTIFHGQITNVVNQHQQKHYTWAKIWFKTTSNAKAMENKIYHQSDIWPLFCPTSYLALLRACSTRRLSRKP